MNFSDLVNWIMENVEGINDRREARKFIGNMLRKNYIRHTVNKLTFSENSYYQFGEGDVGIHPLLNEDDGNYQEYSRHNVQSLISKPSIRFSVDINRT